VTRISEEDSIESSTPIMADAAFNIIEPALLALDATGLPDGTLLRDACELVVRGTPEKPGTYMTKLYSARRFRALGIEKDSPVKPAKFFWTPLGRALIDPETAPEARIEAFLNVPLHVAVIARINTGEKVDDEKIAAVMRDEFHVSDSRVIVSARKVLKRAARQAGLLDKEDRWAIPPGVSWTNGEVSQEVREVMDQASFIPQPSESAVTAITPARVSTPQTVINPLADMDGIVNMVVRNLESMSADEFDAWHRWLDSTIEYAKIRSRKRQ
jgi:hypothetical protein